MLTMPSTPVLSTPLRSPPKDGQTTRAGERDRPAVRVEPGGELGVRCRAIGVVLHIVFASPGELHRSARDGLGDLHRFADKIGAAAAAESAAQILGVDVDLVRRKLGDPRRGLLRDGLDLRAGPDFAMSRR